MSLFSNKPTFLIIGTQKAATSSLYTYLIQHPNILPAKVKEINFFNVDDNYQKGITWYNEQFTKYLNPFKKHLSFEATPEYLYIPYVPERIYTYNPDMKFVIILRDPVKRAYSAWNMFKKLHGLNRLPSVLEKGYIQNKDNNLTKILFTKNYPSFEECVQLEFEYMKNHSAFLEPSFIRRGIYHEQIERYFTYFNRKQFLILDYADFKFDLSGILQQTTTFLGLRDFELESDNYNITNKGEYSQNNDPSNFKELYDFFKPHNEKLYSLINKHFSWSY